MKPSPVCGFVSALLLILTASHVAAADIDAPERPPNIVFIFIDDMGYADPGCFGNPLMKTPRIDQLADEGLKLTNFYVNSPICSPSRVAVSTGQYPMRWGIHSYLNSRKINAERGMKNFLDPAAPTIAKLLKSKGYATAHFGKWHMGGGRDVGDAPLPAAYGFDESLVSFEGLGDRVMPPGTVKGKGLTGQSLALGRGEIFETERWKNTERYTDRAVAFMRRHRDQPFYIRLFPNDVHDPHVPTPGTVEKWTTITDDESWQKFFAVLEEMDRQIGRVIDELETLGLTEQTLIVFTSDNGPTDWPKYYQVRNRKHPPGFTGPYFGRKWSLYEGGIRMPFIARWPGHIPAGSTDELSVMCGIDLAPTFARIAGSEIPEGVRFDGHDRSRVLLGTSSERPEPVFWQYGAPHARLEPGNPDYISPTLAVRAGDMKLLANADGSDAQLYDLRNDPGEKTNLWEEDRDTANEMWRWIQEWAAEVGLKVDPEAPLKPAAPSAIVFIGKRMTEVRNHHAKYAAEENRFTFDGQAWLDLPRPDAPEVAGKTIAIALVLEKIGAPDGVLAAHGGDRSGYSLHLVEGRPAFSVCVDWKRTTIAAKTALPPDRRQRLTAKLGSSGKMTLSVDGTIVAEGKAPGALESNPGDSVQIGADHIKAVGDYRVPNTFTGVLSEVRIEISNPKQ